MIELGCGTAYVSAWLARRGARPVGVDLSAKQLETARAMQAEHGLAFPLHHASAEDVPLPDAGFDLAVSEYGASLWCDPDAWVAEAARLLRPGGLLVFLTNSLIATLCSPDTGPAGERLVRDQRGLRAVTLPGRRRRRVPPRPRRVDRDAGPPRFRRRGTARAVRPARRGSRALRMGHARVGAPLAARGALARAEGLAARGHRKWPVSFQCQMTRCSRM